MTHFGSSGSARTLLRRRIPHCILLGISINFACFSQVRVPDGTKIRVRLEQTVSSATADEGQIVELAVAEPVKIGNVIAIAEGARVTGTITEAQEKRRMGRAGKLDFSIDRVRAVNEQWIPLRYTLNKKSGQSHAVATGVLTAGAAIVFWPAAPVFLLMKGKDITINKGVTFDVFTDTEHLLGPAPLMASAQAPAGMSAAPANPLAAAAGPATVSVTCSVAGADISVDGAFVGNTPTTLQLSGGQHHVAVRSGSRMWERTVQVNSGSTVSLSATF